MTRIIRADGARRLLPAAELTAAEEARRIVERAQAEAEVIVEAARTSAERIRQDAAHAGQQAAHLELATQLVDAERLRQGALAAAESEAVALALRAAARVVEAELELAPERILDIVKSHVDRTRRARKVTLRVHPDDARTLARGPLEYVVEADSSIVRGGCVVVSELGTVDARVETQLNALTSALGVSIDE